METDKEPAHLRVLPKSESCVLTFFLTFESDKGTITKEMKSCIKQSGTLLDFKRQITKDILALTKPDKRLRVNFIKDGGRSYKQTIQLEDFTKITEPKYLKVLDIIFLIVLNAPLIWKMKLPTAIYSGYSVELTHFQYQFLFKDASQFIWSKSLDKNQWEKIGEGFTFTPRNEDVGHFLKLCCVPYNQDKVKGPICEVVSENEVMEMTDLPECPFELRHKKTGRKLYGNRFRVVSYNILADRYVDQNKFHYCPLKALGIHYRKQLIMQEIGGFNADIVCLQEMDQTHFESYYRSKLKDEGFESFFHRKGNCLSEGLVCAFRSSRYSLLQVDFMVMRDALELDLDRFKEMKEILNMNEDVKAEFLKHYTSLQTLVLEDQTTNKFVIVGNTHLFYHPDADHIRLLQAFMACLQLKWWSDKIMREKNNSKVPIVFCGDFNSHYERSLYEFMTSGSVDPQHDDCLKILPDGNALLTHQFHLKSACGKPEYTNYTDTYKGCLDYIFIEYRKLHVENIVPVDTKQQLEKYVGLPNEFYPSDHLPLIVDLCFKK